VWWVALVRWAPGSSSPRHRHPGGVEVFVLEGVFQDEHGHYPSGSWIRGPDGWEHTPFSGTACLCYVKSGHLAT
jgi:anti-sigma factor ChrR (cupin superfamily)